MTTSRVQSGEPNAMGPISYLIVEFPGSKMTGEGFPILVDLVDRGLIRILDLRFVRRETCDVLDSAPIDVCADPQRDASVQLWRSSQDCSPRGILDRQPTLPDARSGDRVLGS